MDIFFSFFSCVVALIFCFVLSVMADKTVDHCSSDDDASNITWAHAVNSKDDLLKELAGSVSFLEADVSLGDVEGKVLSQNIPIMAHPPVVTSNISLEEWVHILIKHNYDRGVKLDFKSTEVLKPSLQILKSLSNKCNFTLWLNADILYGPVHSKVHPVEEETFLKLCEEYFPSAVLSVGWTTSVTHTHQSSWHYEWTHVRKMADVVKCFRYKHHPPLFTFPVRGIFASRSIKQLQWLLETVPESTLTVWSGQTDPLIIEDLIQIRKSFPKNRVYYDLPSRLQKPFWEIKDGEDCVPTPDQNTKGNQWLTLTDGVDHSCSSNTYVSKKSIVFGKSPRTNSAVLLRKLLVADDTKTLKITGKLFFFDDYDVPKMGKCELSIAVTDVSHFSKNSPVDGNINLPESDTKVVWQALNASHLHTFKHDFKTASSACYFFQLDTSEDHSFQVWTVDCDDLDSQESTKGIVAGGRPTISSRKRMVLPNAPFMIGFVSYGDGHAVIYDFEQSDEKKNLSSQSSTLFKSVALIGLSIVLGYIVKRYLL